MGQELIALCGDAVQELKKLKDGSVDLIVTDPPYNLNKDYGSSRDSMDADEYLAFCREWLGEACRALKAGGTLYCFMGMRYISYVYAILERELGMDFNSWITWFYTQGVGKTRGFSPRHDDILMFTKGGSFVFDLDAVRVPQKYYRSVNNMRGANPGNVWEFSHMHYCSRNRKQHPTQKPEGLFERMILASSREGDLVADPFMGSGTCLRVCQQLGRSCIGIDNNPEYVRMAQKRLEEPFVGFDSIDEKLLRCPNDLNDAAVRMEYIENHIKWFLTKHPDGVRTFLEEVKEKYLDKMTASGQTWIFDRYGVEH